MQLKWPDNIPVGSKFRPFFLCLIFFSASVSYAQTQDTIKCKTQKLWTHQGAWNDLLPANCTGLAFEEVTGNMIITYKKVQDKLMESITARCGTELAEMVKIIEVRKLTTPCSGIHFIFRLAITFQEGWDYRFSIKTDAKGSVVQGTEIPLPEAGKGAAADIKFIAPCDAAQVATTRPAITKPLTYIQPGYSAKHNALVWEVWGYGQMPAEKLKASPFLYDPHRDVPERIHQVAIIKAGGTELLDVEQRTSVNITIPDPEGVHPIIRKRDKEKDRD
jgi:hypothetical protein